MKYYPILPLLLAITFAHGQSLAVYQLNTEETIRLDGRLDEAAWMRADSIDRLTMVEPDEGRKAGQRTIVRVLADSRHVYVGVRCYDDRPDKIISYSKIRDSGMRSEDRIKLVFDTYLDQRSGYIFAVNPEGTRYDALVARSGESENSDWDGIWDAKTSVNAQGWTVEIIIPIRSISFSSKTDSWGFNIERRIQRTLERDRWTGLKRDYKISQVVQAGRLTGLPPFDLGIGLTSKASLITQTQRSRETSAVNDLDYSLDFTQKITSDVNLQVTVNTDFAETEVDARRTNLTRFPLFFPEKRGFFLEGSDIFDFGIGLRRAIVPFYSRRIGLYEGTKIPIVVGGKINGKVNDTNFGALVTRTAAVSGLAPATTLGAFRVKQNVLEESSIGMMGTIGDPQSGESVWMLGADMTYRTSHFLDDKVFLAGVWGLYNKNHHYQGDPSALGFKIDYPNDLFDISLTGLRIGDAFQPSLGFVPRPGTLSLRFGFDYTPRPDWENIRQFFFESGARIISNLRGEWETYGIFTAPIHFLLESGDRFEFNIVPQGENLPEDFEISDGVVLEKGPYHWRRYRLEFESASKRVINGQATWWFGSFYNGRLDQVQLELNARPFSSLNLSLNVERNIARLPEGDFHQDLLGGRLQYSFTPNFELSSFIQYDNETRSVGSNTRLRWTFDLLGDLFIVYNHNIDKVENRYWQYDSNQLIVKLSYGVWN